MCSNFTKMCCNGTYFISFYGDADLLFDFTY